jgi:uncharacterized protein
VAPRRTVFVDTGYLVALLDPRDTLNPRALEVAKALAKDGAALLTTDAVVLEVGNYFARGPLRSHAAKWIRTLRVAPGWEVAPVERALLLHAEKRYASHEDKNWSLTDCHSMELMRARELSEVATPDAGFAQAGFRCLLHG